MSTRSLPVEEDKVVELEEAEVEEFGTSAS